MSNRYGIPGFFEDVEVKNGKIKEPGFLGRILFVIKGNEIRKPGFGGETILVIKDGKIKEPGFFGETLFYLDENGVVKETGFFGRAVGAFPLYPGMGPRRKELHEVDVEQSVSPGRDRPDEPQSATINHEESLSALERRLDLESGYSADYTNCKPEAKTIKVPVRYEIFTSIAPALKAVETVYIHTRVKEIKQANIHCLKEYIVDPGNPYFTSIDGIIYNKEVTTVVAVPSGIDFSAFRFPNTVEAFRRGAFQVVFNSFFIQKGIKDPGDLSVKKRFEIEEGNPYLKVVDGILYSADGKILFSVPRRVKLGSLVIPEGVELIAADAFREARADTVILPRSLRAIEDGAFVSSRIAKIFIPDTVERIGRWNFVWIKGLTIECQAKEKGPKWANEWIERNLDDYKPTVLFGVEKPDF